MSLKEKIKDLIRSYQTPLSVDRITAQILQAVEEDRKAKKCKRVKEDLMQKIFFPAEQQVLDEIREYPDIDKYRGKFDKNILANDVKNWQKRLKKND